MSSTPTKRENIETITRVINKIMLEVYFFIITPP
jgi:hypothetical protein